MYNGLDKAGPATMAPKVERSIQELSTHACGFSEVILAQLEAVVQSLDGGGATSGKDQSRPSMPIAMNMQEVLNNLERMEKQIQVLRHKLFN